MPPSPPIHLQTLSNAEFLSTSLASLLLLLKTTAGRCTVEEILSILSHVGFDSSLFEKQLKSLEQCKNVSKASVRGKLNKSDTLFVFLYFDVVDFEVVETFRSKQYNKPFLFPNTFATMPPLLSLALSYYI